MKKFCNVRISFLSLQEEEASRKYLKKDVAGNCCIYQTREAQLLNHRFPSVTGAHFVFRNRWLGEIRIMESKGSNRRRNAGCMNTRKERNIE
jgi:hypothetical protein